MGVVVRTGEQYYVGVGITPQPQRGERTRSRVEHRAPTTGTPKSAGGRLGVRDAMVGSGVVRARRAKSSEAVMSE